MKSKLNIKSILIMALIGIFSLFFLGKSFAAVMGKVNTEGVNIREETNADSKIVEQASKGESVEVIEKNGAWYKVKYNGVEGYIREDLLEVSGNVTETGVTESNKTTNEVIANEEKTAENTTAIENQTTVKVEEKNEENKGQEKVAEKNTSDNVLEGMYVVNSDITLKLIPLVNGMSIKEIKKDTTISVLEVYNNWALVENGLDRGWVLFGKIKKVEENSIVAEQNVEEKKEETENKEEEKKEETENKEEEKQEEKSTEVSVAEKTMYINWDLVNLREQPSKESNAITTLTKATEVIVFAKDGEWSKVRVDGNEGYIKTSLLSDEKPEVVTSRNLEQERQPIPQEEKVSEQPVKKAEQKEVVEEKTVNEQPATNSGLAEQVCNYARQYLGCNYVYGGTTPKGFDCSGFTQYVFKNFGIYLNRTAEAQASNGYYVPKSELQAGDLLIFTHHAGIYLGDGTFIHAANSNSGVIITSLYDSYYVRNYITARRVL